MVSIPTRRRHSSKPSRSWKGWAAQTREVSFPQRMKTAGRAQQIIRICEAAAYHRQFLLTRADRYISDVGSSGPDVSRVRTRRRSWLAAHRRAVPAGPACPLPLHRGHVQGVRTARRRWSARRCRHPPECRSTLRRRSETGGTCPDSLPSRCHADSRRTRPACRSACRSAASPFDDALVLAVAHAYESSHELAHSGGPIARRASVRTSD